ncbi:hypothetical protein [Heyndrickxia sporothermodurans]|uniref:hypothetical protein n=1 Tax=Heyndrickxia sporothermodurans TaxID=46224 RepID=UPI002E220646|nr:hypothetical protein [Heyndrickxia sporothermodurans]MED3696921.1 hypothetical protein [Heyndrickxia sporothermodurans]
MKEITFNKNNILLFFVLLLSILPVIKLGGFEIPFLYLLLPFGVFILIYIFLGWYKIPKIARLLILFFLLIILEIFLSALYGTVSVLGGFIFPSDILQYVVRFITMLSFIVVFYYRKVDADIFIKYFLLFLNIGMLIGFLQWIPWPGRELLVKLYPFYNITYQMDQLSNTMSGIRVHGLAQHATANGGLATFFFAFGFSVFKFYKKYKLLSISLIILSIINIFASQARAGMLALVFSIFVFYLISIYVNRKSFKPTFYVVIVSFFIYIIILFLYKNGNPFIEKMVYRWQVLIFEEKGGGRVDQFYYFLSFLRNPLDYLLGLSKQVVNQSAISFGIEIEPANIFVTYGIVGFILQYSLVLILLIYFLKGMRKAIQNKASLTLLVAAFVGLASYQIFSVGYYFFREIRVGLFPWILIGVAIGVYEKTKNRAKLKNNKYQECR